MGKTKLPIISRSLIPKIREAVTKAMKNQPTTTFDTAMSK